MLYSHCESSTERRFKNTVITFHNGRVGWNNPSGQEHGAARTVILENKPLRVNFDPSLQEAECKHATRCGC